MIKKQVIAACADTWDSFYLYDEGGIRKSMRALQENFPQVRFLYSIKCNPHPQILSCIFSGGFGADAASAGEVLLAREAGLCGEEIFYSAPGKSRTDIESCIGKAVLIADSPDEIERIRKAAENAGTAAEIGIRVNPGFSFEDDCGHPSKFGIDEEQALQLIKDGSFANVKIVGLHIHLRCQILSGQALAAYYQKVLSLAERFMQGGRSLKFVNMGSGMGVPYAPQDRPLDLAALGRMAGPILNRFCAAHPDTRLMIEVGRYVVCKNGFYVTKVMDRKISHGKTYLILNNTLNGFIRPALASAAGQLAGQKRLPGVEPLFTSVDACEFLTLKEGPPTETVSLVGNLCTAADQIAAELRMPHLECGDVIIMTNAGSYAAVLSPFQFSSHAKPAELFLSQNGEEFI